MRAAISIPNMGDPDGIVDLAVTAEEAGWDGVFLWDHLHFVRSLALDVVDPWVTLGAIAHATEHVRLGTLVTPLPRRRPWKLAKEVITLDHLSGGRVILGVGLGEPAADEYGAFGEETDARARAELLDEGLELVDGFLRGNAVAHGGERFHVHAHLLPGARQQPRPPIWIAGKWPNRRPLERARRWDGYMPIQPDGEPAGAEVIAEAAAAIAGSGIELVATGAPGAPAAAYAEAGATWFVESTWPGPAGWLDELRARAAGGPPEPVG
jgi:alkanesulfonate monooxygenase SsuD/methylene tetrahydromethanopterin reductase-like flavin-dependent oxidoreductase (luciferase family)